jgi:hypothetical protein
MTAAADILSTSSNNRPRRRWHLRSGRASYLRALIVKQGWHIVHFNTQERQNECVSVWSFHADEHARHSVEIGVA